MSVVIAGDPVKLHGPRDFSQYEPHALHAGARVKPFLRHV